MVNVNFEEILQYALRSQLSYAISEAGWQITEQLGWRRSSPYQIHIQEVPEPNINVIVEWDDSQQVQWIAVRGSDNLQNWFEDFDYPMKNYSLKFGEKTLSIDLHNGFYQASHKVWEAIKPHLHQKYQTRITGHSLGGAVAAILMIFCHYDEEFSLEKCITFGQPKITNRDGAKQLAHLPLLRVINQEDLVTRVPPDINGYVHFGPELQLQPSSYVFRCEHTEHSVTENVKKVLNTDIKDLLQGGHDLLGDCKEHYIQNYLHNLTSNLESSEQTQQSLLIK